MSKYNVPRVNVTFKDINKIEEGYRVYRNTATFDENSLPVPLVDIPANQLEDFKNYNHFDDTVADGTTYFYRVGAYGGGEELLSDEKEVVADVSIDSFLYSSGVDRMVRKLSSAGEEIWAIPSGDSSTVYGIDCDDEGNAYYGGHSKVKKLNPSGGVIWTYGNATLLYIRSLRIDADYNVYFSSNSDNSIRKLDPNGNLVWTFTGHTAVVWGLAVDVNGYVYSGSNDSTVKKIDPDGNEVWSFSGHTDAVYGVAVDADGYVYTASFDETVKKIDPDGNEVWTFTGSTVDVRKVAVDDKQFVYIAIEGGLTRVIKKLDRDGNEIWSYNGGGYDVAVDADGYVYSPHYSSNTIIKLDPDGDLVWTFTGASAAFERPACVAVYPGSLHVSHGLPF